MLEILHHQNGLVAVNKPAGQLVHPSGHPKEGDEVTMKILRDQIGEEVELLHRLDQPTCGVLLFALERRIAKKMRALFELRRVKKTYLAVVVGHPGNERWINRTSLQKDEDAAPKSALTHFRTLKKLPSGLALVEAQPITGRFHQIRRHLLADGHPIVGDFRYRDEAESFVLGEALGIGTRMLLQASQVEFDHPFTKEPILISAPSDSAFAQVLG